VALAISYGGDPGAWLEDPRALVTAVEVLEEMDRKRRNR
jgi:hypothetical protein